MPVRPPGECRRSVDDGVHGSGSIKGTPAARAAASSGSSLEAMAGLRDPFSKREFTFDSKQKLEGIARRTGIVIKHLDGIQRVIGKIATDQIKLLQNIWRDRDDVAADLVRLNHV